MGGQHKKIWFEIPFLGVTLKKKELVIPKYSLPYSNWKKHNQIDDGDFIAGIRNPLDRVILHYEQQSKNRRAIVQYPISFTEWCTRCFNTSQSDRFMRNNPKEFLSQKQWLEGSNDDIGLIEINTSENNSSLIKAIQQIDRSYYYTEETVKLVLNWYAEDFELFNFETNWK